MAQKALNKQLKKFGTYCHVMKHEYFINTSVKE